MVKSLDKKWKELLFSFSGFGPNLLMVIMGAYFSDAINPAALNAAPEQAIIPGICLILPAVFPILFMIAKAFDGIIDIPFASITDNLKTKWGRRRPPILISFIPMVISFAMCWTPLFLGNEPSMQLANTIWIFGWSLVFFSTYTMCLISFYGSLSTVCSSSDQRTRVSSFKAFFDTISYCIAYALVPVIVGALHKSLGISINTFILILLPVMLTMLIPLFLIKEGAKYGYPERSEINEKPVRILESIKLTFGNKMFVKWMIVNCCSFFGLQMFLSGMNTMITGSMGMVDWEMSVLNTFAFAPVPIMLYLFNKVKIKKGTRFVFQTSLLAFAVAILSFFFGSVFITGGNKTVQYILGISGGVVASWSIGSFFMMPYAIPSQISSVERRLTGKNYSAMYFAAQAVTSSVVGAVASGLVYEYIKRIFFSTEVSGFITADSYEQAAEILNVSKDAVFNFGTLILPFIVSIMCIVGFFVAFTMPKDFSPVLIARELKKQYPDLDISEIEREAEGRDETHESIFIKIILSVLSGFVFGFVWIGIMFGEIKQVTDKMFNRYLQYFLCAFVPFYAVYWLINTDKQLKAAYESRGIEYKSYLPVMLPFAVIFPILPLNIVALSLIQKNVNKLLDYNAAASSAVIGGKPSSVSAS